MGKVDKEVLSLEYFKLGAMIELKARVGRGEYEVVRRGLNAESSSILR